MDREAPERAELLHYLAALGAKPDQLHRAALVPLPDLAELVRWWNLAAAEHPGRRRGVGWRGGVL